MTKLKIVEIAKAAPVESVVNLCRDLLTRAESGELRSFACVVELLDGSRDSFKSETNDIFAMLASVTRLQHRIQRAMDDAMTAGSS